MTLKEELITALKTEFPKERVHIPGMDAPVYLRVLTGSERDEYERGVLERTIPIRAGLLAYALCDEDGKKLFNPKVDLKLIGSFPARTLDAIYSVAMSLNAISKADIDELKKSSEILSGNDSSSP